MDFPTAPPGTIRLRWYPGAGRSEPVFAVAALAARRALDVRGEIGLVLRAWRHDRQLSQRSLAEELGLSKTTVGRIEHDPSGATLETVLRALECTGHTLRVVLIGGDEEMDADECDDGDGGSVIPGDRWTAADLVARDRGGRRFPAAMDVRRAPRFSGVDYRWTRYRGDEPPWRARRRTTGVIGPTDSRANAREA